MMTQLANHSTITSLLEEQDEFLYNFLIDGVFDFDCNFPEGTLVPIVSSADENASPAEFTPYTSYVYPVHNQDDFKVVKCTNLAKRGSKFIHKVPIKTKRNDLALQQRGLKPNMSRRLLTRDTPLYVFPSFDRSDSLLYFPCSLARHLNSGDLPSISQLFNSHLRKDCHIETIKECNFKIDIPSLIRLYEVNFELHPDRIMCIHTTKIEGNVIRATAYSKSTNVRSLYSSVSKSVKNEPNYSVFSNTWEGMMRKKIQKEDQPEELKQRFLVMLEKQCDLLVYTRTDIVIEIDDVRNKIVSLKMIMTTTDMREVRRDDSSASN